MLIIPTTQNNFRGTGPARIEKLTKIYLPTKKGTMRCVITGRDIHKITAIKCNLQEGKNVTTMMYQNKRGFGPERLAGIYEKIQQNVKDGVDFLNELIKAQGKNGF